VLTVHGRGVLDVNAWKQRDSYTVHLVNLTNPMMMKGPIREVIPIGAQAVRLRVSNVRVKRVRTLVAGATLPFRQAAEWLTLTVPSIGEHEVVAIDV
jgi:hypothetical protein